MIGGGRSKTTYRANKSTGYSTGSSFLSIQPRILRGVGSMCCFFCSTKIKQMVCLKICVSETKTTTRNKLVCLKTMQKLASPETRPLPPEPPAAALRSSSHRYARTRSSAAVSPPRHCSSARGSGASPGKKKRRKLLG